MLFLIKLKTKITYISFINVNGDNAGYIGLSKKQDLLFLSKLYIKRNSDTKVWAQKLLSLLKISQKKIIIKNIILTVNKYNTNTINAYKKWNFHEIDSVVTDIGNGFVMDDYIMEYCL